MKIDVSQSQVTKTEPGVAHGFVSSGYEAVVDHFDTNLRERGDSGSAFSAYVDGTLVVDLWGGLADAETGKPWQRGSIVCIFSGTKGFVATCLLLLIERGLVDLEKPVSFYWPEFAARGKECVLVRHVVSHLAGIPGLLTPVSSEEATDDTRMARLLADQATIHEPGTQLYYHALTFGWICGELIRRVDGRSLGRFFAEEVAKPLGLDAWIGLPEEHEIRVAAVRQGQGFGSKEWYRDAGAPRDEAAWSIWANPPRFSAEPLPANTEYWHRAEVPASNGIASASSVARLYGCLARGGEIDGFRLLAPQTVQLGRTCLAKGMEPYLSKRLAYGVGFQLQTEDAPFGPPAIAYGHNGAGGSVHGAWPHLRTGFSYVTNTLQEHEKTDPRSTALLRALHECLTVKRGKSHGHV